MCIMDIAFVFLKNGKYKLLFLRKQKTWDNKRENIICRCRFVAYFMQQLQEGFNYLKKQKIRAFVCLAQHKHFCINF